MFAKHITPGKLKYSIAEQPATVHDLLLQKSDRSFVLLVWNERVKGSDEVRIDLGGSHPGIKICDPTIGTDPMRTHDKVDSLSLTLSDHPLVVIIPGK